MARRRKSLKSRRKCVKRSSRRRGGQVTPLSDISTNSSMHDLETDDLDVDVYDEPSNNTTSESTLSDATTSSMTNGPIATNLLGQFNAATDNEFGNLTNNTTTESETSSDNSFSNVATSFEGLGHGGKRRTRKSRKSRKSRKNRRR